MKLKELIDVFEEFAPSRIQEEYDNSGLLIGNHENDIQSALLCIDCTPEVIHEAVSKKIDLVICHHPIIFSGLKQITGRDYVQRTVIDAIKNDISIYACHTNLDNAFGGVSWKMAEKIGLGNCNTLAPKSGMLKKLVTFCPLEKSEYLKSKLFEVGAGHIGNYDSCSFSVSGTGTFRASEGTNPYVGKIGDLHQEKEERIEMVFPSFIQSKVISTLISSHPYEEVAYDVYSLNNSHGKVGSGIYGELDKPLKFEDFLTQVKTVFKCDVIRHTKKVHDKVQKVALCGGSGSFLLNAALSKGADVFISSDFKYHDFFDADNQISILDIGHYESEQYTTELFAEIISKKFPTFAVYFSDINTNPIKTF